MEFLKEKKGIIISFIMGVIIASSITVYATSYFAKDISYTKPGANTEISVEDALNDLYIKINENNNDMLFDLTSETTSSNTSYNLRKTTAVLNQETNDILIRIQADKVTDSVNSYTIDISKLELDSINYVTVYNLGSSSNFYLVESSFTTSSISFYLDTNRYNASKINQDFIIKCSYSK